MGALRSAINIYYGDNEGEYPADGCGGGGHTCQGTTGQPGLFAALSDKYLPPRRGVPSLGQYDIPAFSFQNNPGHSGGYYDNATDEPAVMYSALGMDYTQSIAIDGLAPLLYNFVSGSVYINCTHNDSKGTVWSAN